jgi:hypothetical protein
VNADNGLNWTSDWVKTDHDFYTGFDEGRLSPDISSSDADFLVFESLVFQSIAGLMQSRGGAIEPFPTRDRNVSGIRLTLKPGSALTLTGTHKTRGTSTTPVAIARNQKIALHPSVWAKTPPSKGPKVGPSMALAWNSAMNLPFS